MFLDPWVHHVGQVACVMDRQVAGVTQLLELAMQSSGDCRLYQFHHGSQGAGAIFESLFLSLRELDVAASRIRGDQFGEKIFDHLTPNKRPEEGFLVLSQGPTTSATRLKKGIDPGWRSGVEKSMGHLRVVRAQAAKYERLFRGQRDLLRRCLPLVVWVQAVDAVPDVVEAPVSAQGAIQTGSP